MSAEVIEETPIPPAAIDIAEGCLADEGCPGMAHYEGPVMRELAVRACAASGIEARCQGARSGEVLKSGAIQYCGLSSLAKAAVGRRNPINVGASPEEARAVDTARATIAELTN